LTGAAAPLLLAMQQHRLQSPREAVATARIYRGDGINPPSIEGTTTRRVFVK
jgi:hypothetical protein